MKTVQKTYRDAVAIPEGKVGKYRIEHFVIEKGKPVMLCNMRNALMGGQRGPANVVYDAPTKWHRLAYDGGVWMTDLPVEQRQHDEQMKRLTDLARRRGGNVIIGGLGLGYAVNEWAKILKVKQIVVVEKSPEVCQLVEAHVRHHGKMRLTNEDLFDYLASPSAPRFDWAFFDIWQSDGEGTFFHVVAPLLELAYGKVKFRPVCWNEDVMRGQLRMNLNSRLLFALNQHPAWTGAAKPPTIDDLCEAKGTVYWDWAVPFFQAVRSNEWGMEEASSMAELYAETVMDPWDYPADLFGPGPAVSRANRE